MLKGMRIGLRLGLVFGLLVLMLAVVASVGLYEMAQITKTVINIAS